MEALRSCKLTPSDCINASSGHHPIEPSWVKPLYNRSHKNSDLKTNVVSVPALYPLVPEKRNPKLSLKKGVFSSTMFIHKKNPHIIYREIQRFASQNKLREAFLLLEYLEHSGVPANVTTFVALIAACIRIKSIDAAKQVHAHMGKNGLEKNEFLCTRLVHLYACCGSIEDAKGVFETMHVTSVYPWNALLRGKVVMGGRNQGEVLSSFIEMQTFFELDVYSFSCLIKSLAGNHSLRQGLKTHGFLIKNGFYASDLLKTSLIDMYFKCGKIKLACSIFDEVEEKDVVVWGAMIAGFAHNRLQREALRYTKRMINEGIPVNSVILTTILPVTGEISSRKIGQELHAYMIKRRCYSKESFIHSALIDMYCKCGDMVSARKIFYTSNTRNTVSWTALVSGYVLNGRLEQALRSIIWMQQEGFCPDIVTIATVIPVCAELRALNPGMEIHTYAVKNGYLPDVSVSSSLMMMYSKCNNLKYSSRLFHMMKKKNVIVWTAMMECFIESKCFNEALDVFRSMQLSKHKPDSVTLARTLHICGKLNTLKLGKELHGQVLKLSLESAPILSTELVRTYGACGRIETAKSLFESISMKGSMAWTALIEAYGCNSQAEEALVFFKQMLSDGLRPTHFTFRAVLRICDDAGFADDAVKLIGMMTGKYRINASDEHYSCVIRVLSRLGRSEEAERFTELRNLHCSRE